MHLKCILLITSCFILSSSSARRWGGGGGFSRGSTQFSSSPRFSPSPSFSARGPRTTSTFHIPRADSAPPLSSFPSSFQSFSTPYHVPRSASASSLSSSPLPSQHKFSVIHPASAPPLSSLSRLPPLPSQRQFSVPPTIGSRIPPPTPLQPNPWSNNLPKTGSSIPNTSPLLPPPLRSVNHNPSTVGSRIPPPPPLPPSPWSNNLPKTGPGIPKPPPLPPAQPTSINPTFPNSLHIPKAASAPPLSSLAALSRLPALPPKGKFLNPSTAGSRIPLPPPLPSNPWSNNPPKTGTGVPRPPAPSSHTLITPIVVSPTLRIQPQRNTTNANGNSLNPANTQNSNRILSETTALANLSELPPVNPFHAGKNSSEGFKSGFNAAKGNSLNITDNTSLETIANSWGSSGGSAIGRNVTGNAKLKETVHSKKRNFPVNSKGRPVLNGSHLSNHTRHNNIRNDTGNGFLAGAGPITQMQIPQTTSAPPISSLEALSRLPALPPKRKFLANSSELPPVNPFNAGKNSSEGFKSGFNGAKGNSLNITDNTSLETIANSWGSSGGSAMGRNVTGNTMLKGTVHSKTRNFPVNSKGSPVLNGSHLSTHTRHNNTRNATGNGFLAGAGPITQMQPSTIANYPWDGVKASDNPQPTANNTMSPLDNPAQQYDANNGDAQRKPRSDVERIINNVGSRPIGPKMAGFGLNSGLNGQSWDAKHKEFERKSSVNNRPPTKPSKVMKNQIIVISILISIILIAAGVIVYFCNRN